MPATSVIVCLRNRDAQRLMAIMTYYMILPVSTIVD